MKQVTFDLKRKLMRNNTGVIACNVIKYAMLHNMINRITTFNT